MDNKIKIIIGILIVVILFFVFRNCNRQSEPINSFSIPLENTKLKDIERLTFELGIERNKTDSLKALKSKVVNHYHTVYDSVYIHSDSVCKAALTITHNECLKLDSVNINIIHGQETQLIKYSEVVNDYKDIIVLKDYKHSQDSINIIGLNDEIKHQKKRVVKAKIGGVLYSIGGLLVGFGAGKVMP